MKKCRWAFFSRALLAVFFTAAGAMHFIRPGFYFRMMPPYIPAPLFMIYLSGILEISLGLLMLPSKTRRMAGWGLIAVLAAVFPANIHLALNPEILPEAPEWLLWVRLPFQGFFVFWVWSVMHQPSGTADGGKKA